MGKKKIILIIVIICILGYFIIPRLWTVGIGKQPEISVYDVSLEGLGLKGMSLNVVLEVYNPNAFSITFDRGEFNAYIDNDYVGSGSFPYTTIAGKSTRYVDARTTISWGGGLKGMWNVFVGKITGTGSTMRIDGTAYVDVPILGTVSIPISHQKVI